MVSGRQNTKQSSKPAKKPQKTGIPLNSNINIQIDQPGGGCLLDTISTTRSVSENQLFAIEQTSLQKDHCPPETDNPKKPKKTKKRRSILDKIAMDFKKDRNIIRAAEFTENRKINRLQAKYIFHEANLSADNQNEMYQLLKAERSLKYCNDTHIINEKNEFLGAWYCGKRFCRICEQRRRNKILNRYLNFFDKTTYGEQIKAEYDFCMLTLTLEHHATGLRAAPYYKELSTHLANGLKYGALKKYIAGGWYNTEHTYNNNEGHHIHRHLIVLIKKDFNVYENKIQIENEIRDHWKQRTGGSWVIDLSPFNYDKEKEPQTFDSFILETTKYMTAATFDESGKFEPVPVQVIRAVQDNSRLKFFSRFGILYRNPEKVECKFLIKDNCTCTSPETCSFQSITTRCKEPHKDCENINKTLCGAKSECTFSKKTIRCKAVYVPELAINNNEGMQMKKERIKSSKQFFLARRLRLRRKAKKIIGYDYQEKYEFFYNKEYLENFFKQQTCNILNYHNRRSDNINRGITKKTYDELKAKLNNFAPKQTNLNFNPCTEITAIRI
jgi:hypothetical protein